MLSRDQKCAMELELAFNPEVSGMGNQWEQIITALREEYGDDMDPMQDNLPSGLRFLNEEMDTDFTLGLHKVEREDWEVERTTRKFVGFQQVEDEFGMPMKKACFENIDVKAFDQTEYWTNSGTMQGSHYLDSNEEFLKRDLAVEGTTRDAEQAPDIQFYSISKAWERKRWVSQERNMHAVVGYVWKNKENKDKLSKAWKRFWVRVYEGKGEQGAPNAFLFSKQVNTVRKLFERFGVKKQGK